MNKIFFLAIIFSLSLLPQCHKEELKPSSNIVLYNQPLKVIRVNLNGSWQLLYVKGGYCVVCPPRKYGTIFFDFNDNDGFIMRDTSAILADTKIDWIYKKDNFGDYTYLLHFVTKSSLPVSYVVDRIKNDTLLLMDDTFDYQTYFLIRSN
jgi:hypothetical protein